MVGPMVKVKYESKINCNIIDLMVLFIEGSGKMENLMAKVKQ